ncbi:penicillin-binding protein 2 [Paremcibacter congregatus]|uniref:Penicillin-binding protein 2 n=1 Tax=Paremcibacter congregatus TaxID=2043170 RepID=A0A2G4YTQ2_9PROT|nr:penicillin-binding protein 2 [Paremcibacter congregatus]PHZ85677.1 penicillin-binding protein 2 [Paremcibacter congregatus]QDE26637.1 penicillin-binding protein 2 [Paremcibacter congregatus]
MATPADDLKYKLFTRRASLLSGGMLVLTSGLVGRLYYLQVVNQSQYKLLADKNRISLRLLAPERGKILDRNGLDLAINRTDYRVNLIPEQTENVEQTLDALNAILPISERQRKRILRAVKRQRGFLPVMVAENLDWDTFARVNINIPDLPGIQPDMGITRYYPEKDLLAHIVGYVASVNEREIGEDPLLELPGFKIGKNGMERVLDQRLRGKAGNSKVEVNVMGRVIRELNRNDSQPGDTLHLTIDRDIQKFTADRVRDESAAVVVIDVHSGELLALTSTPAYDPNDFNLGISQKKYDVLLGDARKPLINKAVQGVYPPGSTFKMIVALAALEAGVIDKDETIFCNSRYKIGNTVKHCWKRTGHGHVSMVEAIAGSCDVYFYEIAGRVGIDKIHEMAARFGLGRKFGIDIPGEKDGINPSKGWKMATRGQRWQGGDTANVGIGQGAVLVTPLQLAVMIARLVNGGRAIKPSILIADREDKPQEPEKIPFNPANMKVIHEGMMAVVNKQFGVAFAQRIREEGMSYGGKTGSAQVRRISKAERDVRVRKNEEKPWIERDHALFVGYGPLENPRYAVSVIVEHGGGGSSKAAPIAKDVLKYMFEQDKAEDKA